MPPPSKSAGKPGPRDPALAYAHRLGALLELDLPLPGIGTGTGSGRSPALAWAGSGAMALTGSGEGPPRFAAGPVASAAAGAGRLLDALAPGRGFERLDAPALLGERAALVGLGRQGAISCGGTTRLLATRDDWLALGLPREDDWRMLEAWLEADLPDVVATRDWSLVASALAARSAQQAQSTSSLVERGRELGLALAAATRSIPATPSPFRLEHTTRSAIPLAPIARGGRRPRVLDLSSLWAGPLAGSLLAQAGCDVVKVESPVRPDGARTGTRAGEPEFFDRLNANKRGAALDLTRTGDRAAFARLLEAADVVLESARPRGLAQLGFDARRWVGARPGRIWASLTGHGRDHEWIAFGDDAAIAAGLGFDPGPTPGPPRFCADAIADPLAGLHAAVAILALLRSGRGGLLGLALSQVAAFAALAPGNVDRDPPCDLPRTSPGALRDEPALVLPIRVEGGDWVVVENGLAHPIAKPRARRAFGRAPALAAPDASLFASWSSPC